MKRPLGIYLLCIVMIGSLLAGIYTWAAIVPRLIAGSGPKAWVEWLAVVVLSAMPFSVSPAVVGTWQRSEWAPGAVFVWGALWVSELTLTIVAMGALAGLKGPEWMLPWAALLAAAVAVSEVVRYVRRRVSEASAPLGDRG